MKRKVNVSGSDRVQHVWRRAVDGCADKKVVLTVKYSGASLMVCG